MAASAGWAAKLLRRLVEGRRARLKPTAAHAAEALSRAGKPDARPDVSSRLPDFTRMLVGDTSMASALAPA